MNKWKKFWNALIHPHGGWLCLFYFVFLCLVILNIYTLVVQPFIPILNIILYSVSAVCMAYFVYSIIYIFPKLKYWLVKAMKKFKFTNKMITSYNFKTVVFTCIGVIINFGFVIFQGVLAIKTKSVWYGSLTIYYLFLTVIGSVIVLSKWINIKLKKQSIKSEVSAYRNSGIMLLVLTIAFAVMVGLTFNALNEIYFAGLMIYVTATFTFFKLLVAILSSIKAKKEGDYYSKAAKNINLATAIISIFSLQVALLEVFGTPDINSTIFNVITGVVIILGVIAMGIYMIVKSFKIKNKYKNKVQIKVTFAEKDDNI